MVQELSKCGKRSISLIEAEMVLARIHSGYCKNKRKEIRCYFCKFCGMYHLTSQMENRYETYSV